MRKLQELWADVRALIDDDSIATPILTGYINEALWDLAPILHIEKVVEIPLVPGQQTYPNQVPASTIDILSARIKDGPPIPRRGIEESHDWGYTFFEGTITVYPVPEKDAVLQLFTVQAPAPVSSPDETVPIPSHFSHLPVLYAAARVKQLDEYIEEKTDLMADYIRAKAQMAEMMGDYVTRRKNRKVKARAWR